MQATKHLNFSTAPLVSVVLGCVLSASAWGHSVDPGEAHGINNNGGMAHHHNGDNGKADNAPNGLGHNGLAGLINQAGGKNENAIHNIVNGESTFRCPDQNGGNPGPIDDTPTAAAPIPGAAWLLGSGILGLAAVARRKRSSAK